MYSLAFLIALQLPTKPIDYDIVRKGIKIGSAKIFTKLTKSGGKKVESKMQVTAQDGEMKLVSAQEWDFEGLPVLKTLQVFGPTGSELRRVRVDFKDSVAKIANFVDGKQQDSAVEAPVGSSLNDLPEFWLIRDEPEKKQVVKHVSFDVNSFKWVPNEVFYLGEQVKTFGATKIKLHHVRRKTVARTDDIWSDGNGILYFSESSDGTSLKRVDSSE